MTDHFSQEKCTLFTYCTDYLIILWKTCYITLHLNWISPEMERMKQQSVWDFFTRVVARLCFAYDSPTFKTNQQPLK